MASLGARHFPRVPQLDSALNRLLPLDQTEVYLLIAGVTIPGQQPTTEQLEAIANRGINFYAYQFGGTSLSSAMQQMATTIDALKSSTGTAKRITSATDLDQVVLVERQVVGILVDGRPVASFDAQSRTFFAPVSVSLGNNVFQVTAVDSAGSTKSFPLTLVGKASTGAIDFSTLEDITPRGYLNYASTTFNRNSNRLSVNVNLQNADSQQALACPIVAIDRVQRTIVRGKYPRPIFGLPPIVLPTRFRERFQCYLQS